MRTPTEAKIFWDSQDRSNEGWAFEISDARGSIDGGPWDACAGELWEKVADFAHRYNLPDHDQWAIDPISEGGWAVWTHQNH